MRDFTEDLDTLSTRLAQAARYLAIDAKRVRVGELEAEMAKPNLWDDPKHGAAVGCGVRPDQRGREAARRDRRPGIEDARTLYQLAVEEGDDSVEGELESLVAAISTSSTSSICGRCSPASSTTATRCARCTPVRAAPTPRTGPR